MSLEVWYAIPSASVDLCRAHLPEWREQGYKVAVLQNKERGEIPADALAWSDAYPGWAASVNLLCADVVPASADIVVTGGDDMLPDQTKTAQEIAREFLERFPDGFGVMQPVGDSFMHTREYCGSPWLGRGWIERAYRGSGPMHPGYAHNWADHELRWVAEGLQALWLREDLAQRHEHHSRTGEQPRDYWVQEVGNRDRGDVEHFMGRFLLGFPGHEPALEDKGDDFSRPIDRQWWMQRYDGTAFRHWMSRYGGTMLGNEYERSLRQMLDFCASRGYGRVGVFGAGTATREAGRALLEPPVEVVALFDERPELIGSRLWGYQVHHLPKALEMGLDALVLQARGDTRPMEKRALDVVGCAVRIVLPPGRLAQKSREVLGGQPSSSCQGA